MAAIRVIPPPEPPKPQETYSILLSRDEARGLAALLANGVKADTRLALHLTLLTDILGATTGFPRVLVDGSEQYVWRDLADVKPGAKVKD